MLLDDQLLPQCGTISLGIFLIAQNALRCDFKGSKRAALR
jgi:hypothetical protein